MPRFILLKLDGVMQGWGGHTYEDWRPTELFPTRSGLLGLLGACLGIDRHDTGRQNTLASSVLFTIQTQNIRTQFGNNKLELKSIRLLDYHTILDARKVDGKPNENPVQSYRWYLFDAPFIVVVEETANASISLEEIVKAIRDPVYTPFLGRRSCPLSRPLIDPGEKPFEAKTAIDALKNYQANGSIIYSESPELISDYKLRMRDVPLYGHIRRFATREVFIHVNQEASYVPK
jgi:CRISPR system Cascade subunit CasD